MKTKEQLETKIARSKARVEARNRYKSEAKLLQGAPMSVSEEVKEAREKAKKKPITPKKWKEVEVCRLVDTRSKTPEGVKPKDFYSDELKARRKDRRERLKKIKQDKNDSYFPQAILYMKRLDCRMRKIDARTHFEMRVMYLRGKDAARAARRQSKEDKAKYKASLVAFKETHVRTNKVQDNNILDVKHRHKKNRKAGRKSTAKVYSINKAKLAA